MKTLSAIEYTEILRFSFSYRIKYIIQSGDTQYLRHHRSVEISVVNNETQTTVGFLDQ